MTNLLTSSEARARLGYMAPSSFKDYVDSGRIRKITPPGRKQGKYMEEDVIRLAQELKLHDPHKFANVSKVKKDSSQKQTREIIHGVIDWISTVDDVLTSLKLDYRVYGPDVFLADLAYYTERVKRNSKVALAVFDSSKKERILAYISLLPLAESVIQEVLRGERHETGIGTEEIETYDRKGAYTLLAESVVVDPDHSEQLNTLLKHLTKYWCDQYPDRYISKIYAQAESRHGDILIQKLFFAPREDLAPNAFVLNMARPGASRFVRQFQECLDAKRKALGEQDHK
jgi:hypothetical protein